MSRALKFAGFTVGQVIRARDFQDSTNMGACYVEGRIVEVHADGGAYRFAHYVIERTLQVWDGLVMNRDQFVGVRVGVPFETSCDFDNRVELVTVTAPDPLLTVWSPDAAAECLDIPRELSARIWNDIVPLYDGAPRSEVPDDFDARSVAKFWHLFTETERAALNAAAVRYMAPPAAASASEEGPDPLRAWYDTSEELR